MNIWYSWICVHRISNIHNPGTMYRVVATIPSVPQNQTKVQCTCLIVVTMTRWLCLINLASNELYLVFGAKDPTLIPHNHVRFLSSINLKFFIIFKFLYNKYFHSYAILNYKSHLWL